MKDQWSEFRLNTEWWMFCIVSLSLIKSTKLLTCAALEFVYSQQCFGFLMMCDTELFLVATWAWRTSIQYLKHNLHVQSKKIYIILHESVLCSVNVLNNIS